MPKAATILCVDDEESGLQLRKLLLESNGYTVLTASDSEAALALFQTNTIDLVITDHLLPKIPGTELARRMKQLKPTVPIALLSGFPEPPDDSQHVNCCIVKGEEPIAVLRKIAELLSSAARRHMLSPVQDEASLSGKRARRGNSTQKPFSGKRAA
jgi:CheY-like chemotaxis protein